MNGSDFCGRKGETQVELIASERGGGFRRHGFPGSCLLCRRFLLCGWHVSSSELSVLGIDWTQTSLPDFGKRHIQQRIEMKVKGFSIWQPFLPKAR
jgi:hypothetical protein